MLSASGRGLSAPRIRWVLYLRARNKRKEINKSKTYVHHRAAFAYTVIRDAVAYSHRRFNEPWPPTSKEPPGKNASPTKYFEKVCVCMNSIGLQFAASYTRFNKSPKSFWEEPRCKVPVGYNGTPQIHPKTVPSHSTITTSI